MTGDPKRKVSFGTYNLKGKPLTELAFDQLTFPACEECNRAFSDLEGRARRVTEQLLGRGPLTSTDFVCLLDWLDKVRIGMWLGLLWLDGNPWGINPNFHISSRLRLHDRSVGIGFIERRQPGINLLGPESPCFGLIPTTFCIFINNLALFNSSSVGLCSRRLGFPYPTDFSFLESSLLEAVMAPGIERVIRPIERIGLLQTQPFIYQPVFGRSGDKSILPEYQTDYVLANSYDFEDGLGAIFLQKRGNVSQVVQEANIEWIPDQVFSLRDAYRNGVRWVYRKLETDYEMQSKTESRLPFAAMHKNIIAALERRMGV